MGAEHSGRLFYLKTPWLIRTDTGESGPRNDTGALLKEKDHNVAEWFYRSKWIAKLISLRDFVKRLNQLNISMQGKDKMFGCVQDIAVFKGTIQLWIHWIESGKIDVFLALTHLQKSQKLICATFVKFFLEHLIASLPVG